MIIQAWRPDYMSVGNMKGYHWPFCYFSIIFFAPCSVFPVNSGHHWDKHRGTLPVCLSDGTPKILSLSYRFGHSLLLLQNKLKTNLENKLKLSVRNSWSFKRGERVWWVWAIIMKDTTDSFVSFDFFAPCSVFPVNGRASPGSRPANQPVCLSDVNTKYFHCVLQIRTFPSPLSFLQKKIQQISKIN